MTFNGYPNLTPQARAAFEQWLVANPDIRWQTVEAYLEEHTLVAKTYKAAAMIESMVLTGTLPPELQVVADCLKIA